MLIKLDTAGKKRPAALRPTLWARACRNKAAEIRRRHYDQRRRDTCRH